MELKLNNEVNLQLKDILNFHQLLTMKNREERVTKIETNEIRTSLIR